MRFLFVVLFFCLLDSKADGPWSAGLLPKESYRYKFDEGFSEWTNYIHRLNLRAHATDYSAPSNANKTYIVFPTNIVEAHKVVVGEENFASIIENVIFTNLIGVSTNNNKEYKTLNVGVNALGKIDDFLITLMTNFVDVKLIEDAGGATAWLNETDLVWQWTLVRTNLCYCQDENGQLVPASNEADCLNADPNIYYAPLWLCPPEAYSWREVLTNRYNLPQLTFTSAWNQAELPIKTNVTIYYNYKKTGFGWEFGMLDNYYWEQIYDEYRDTNYIYGFSVSYRPVTITQSISRINYNAVESFSDNYTIRERIVDDKKEVVIRAEKEFILEATTPLAMQYLDIDYNTADFSSSKTTVRYNFSFTNFPNSMFFEGLEIAGEAAIDSYGVTSSVLIAVQGFNGGHNEHPDGIVLQHSLVKVDEAFGGATFLPVKIVTNYFPVNYVYDENALVKSVFDSIPDWDSGVGYADVITEIEDFYTLTSPTNRRTQRKSYFSLSEISSTNYLNERSKIVDLMSATWSKITYIDYYDPFILTPGLHVAMRTEPFDGTWNGQFNNAKPPNYAWSDKVYDQFWSENYNSCDYLSRKTVRTYSYTAVGGGETNSGSRTQTFYSPDCAEGSEFIQIGYKEAPWDLYWQDNNKRIRNDAYPLIWYAGQDLPGAFNLVKQRNTTTGRSVPDTNRPSVYTTYIDTDNVDGSYFVFTSIVWPKNTGITLSNLTTNVSAQIYQYAIFDNDIGSMIYTNERYHFTNNPSFSTNNKCGIYKQLHKIVVEFSEPPIARAPTNWFQYVPSVEKPITNNWLTFDESRYGVNDSPSSLWLATNKLEVTCVDGFGEENDTTKSWQRGVNTDTIGFVYLKYPEQSRRLNTMIFIMDWSFDFAE